MTANNKAGLERHGLPSMQISMWLETARRFRNGCDFCRIRSLNNSRLVDVVLLPMQGGVGLDDDVFVRGLLQFVYEQGLAGF